MWITILNCIVVMVELLILAIVYGLVQSWYSNKRWEKKIYLIVEEYRAKYGIDEGCELLMFREVNNLVDEETLKEIKKVRK